MTTTNPPVETGETSTPGYQRIGEMLIQNGLITEEQLEHALDKQKEEGGKTFEILLRLGYLDKDELHNVLARHPGIATIDLSRLSLRRDLISLIPHDMALEQLVLPIERIGKNLTLAMACPMDSTTIFEIESITGMRVKPMLCKLDDIVIAVENLYRQPDQPKVAPEDLGQLVTQARGESRATVRGKLETYALTPPQWIARRLSEATGDARIPLMQVGEMIEHDPVALCEVLDLANSVVYGVFAEIDTLPKALVVLDKKGITSLFKQSMEVKSTSRPEWPVLSENAFRSAFVATELRKKIRLKLGKYDVRCATSLCWLGRFAMLELIYSKYKFINHDLVGAALCEAEAKIADMNHTQVGEHLIIQAGLSDRLSHVVRYYATPDEAQSTYQPLAMLANISAHAAVWKDQEDEAGLAGCLPWMQALGVTPQDIRTVLQRYTRQEV